MSCFPLSAAGSGTQREGPGDADDAQPRVLRRGEAAVPLAHIALLGLVVSQGQHTDMELGLIVTHALRRTRTRQDSRHAHTVQARLMSSC
jgi:hypothetical protein